MPSIIQLHAMQNYRVDPYTDPYYRRLIPKDVLKKDVVAQDHEYEHQ